MRKGMSFHVWAWTRQNGLRLLDRARRPIVNMLFGLKVRVTEGLLLGFAFQVPTTRRKDFSSQMVFQPDMEWGRRR